MKKHNFCAGPSILPSAALQSASRAILELDGMGLSLLEISHRSPEFEAINREAEDLFRVLLQVPENYKIFFMGGGASTQFYLVPYNLLECRAGYIDTGVWAHKAMMEAQLFGTVVKVASSEDQNYGYIPKDYQIPADLDYLHITTNNTIYGTQLKEDLLSTVPLVADMSSDIFSRPVQVDRYGLIYGGVQKNIGPAGLSFVVVREDLLGHVSRPLPSMVDYRNQIQYHSMYNTPPVFQIYMVRQTLKWLQAQGGVEAIQPMNEQKAALLYGEIDRNTLFEGTAQIEDRSLMNVCFVMSAPFAHLEVAFLAFANQRGIVAIQGHRLSGGFRASIYNAMPLESVQALVDCMQKFEKEYI